MNQASYTDGYFHATGSDLFHMQGPPGGVPLLLIHGVTSRWQPFQPLLPSLAEKYHVYALDLRGHGKSSHPGAYHLNDYTGDVYEFVSHHIHKPVIVYGHSLGALIAINLAAQHPASVPALILGDPPLYYHNTSTRDTFWCEAFRELLEFMTKYPDPAEMERQLKQIAPNMSPERREERIRSLQGLDIEVVRTILADGLMQGVSLTALVRCVTCPVLLLRGQEHLGSALREQDVVFAATNFRKLELLNMTSVGHTILPTSLLPEVVRFMGAATQPTEEK